MSLPHSLLHYEAEISAWDQARDDAHGIRIGYKTYEDARYFRLRMHHARSLVRQKSKEVYKPGDALYGASVYDNLICRIREDTDGEWWLYIEKNQVIPGVVESLTIEGDLA